jgi:hypothetical protein
MKAQTLELVAMAISEMNQAYIPGSETFVHKNPGRLKVNGSVLRSFTTWSGGLKSLISELSRYPDDGLVLSVARSYGCTSIEKEFVYLDYLTRSLNKTVESNFKLCDLEQESQKEE